MAQHEIDPNGVGCVTAAVNIDSLFERNYPSREIGWQLKEFPQ